VHFKRHVCISVLLWRVSPLLSLTLELNEVVGVMKEWEVEAQASGGHNIINDIRIKGCFLCPTYATEGTFCYFHTNQNSHNLSTCTKDHLFLLLSHSFWCGDCVILSTDVDWLPVDSVTAKIFVRWNPVHLSVKKKNIRQDLFLVLTHNPKSVLWIW
jgi:hypothetical protein